MKYTLNTQEAQRTIIKAGDIVTKDTSGVDHLFIVTSRLTGHMKVDLVSLSSGDTYDMIPVKDVHLFCGQFTGMNQL